MDAATLARAMGCPAERARLYVADFNAAMLAAECTTINRAAMWCAQIGHESAGLRYMEEIASGVAYEGRRDLGNTQVGDGKRFKGRGPIQLTGRANYGLFGKWCAARRMVPAADHFQREPHLVATSRWGFLAASWYWTDARPKLNALADAADLVGATRAINGGTNGLDDRRTRWERCRGIGADLLPDPGAASGPNTTAPAVGGSLAEGATGPHVRRLQEWLNRMFPAYSNIDLGPGRYGPQTVAVVREFQRRAGVTGADADGTVIGPRTLAALAREGFR